ncbi:MAG: 2-C-methyl-D-erythritol 2,4-cyclodiphosphate synthase [Clostridiales bacterium]|nr:2-C-methyl-D-erythritol 2,4-cyclodiphosphate synthase [Clostridiales bacterium]
MRIGIGYDVHQLVENRALIVGGVTIPYEKGLLGHSDADVLLHAIMDSILGALGEGDLGKHFPDHDMQYKGASSLRLLEAVYEMMNKEDYIIGNLDAVIIAQAPKMAAYIAQMKDCIALTLHCEVSCVNLKATTTEHLGFEGRGEGIAAQAVVLLQKSTEPHV